MSAGRASPDECASNQPPGLETLTDWALDEDPPEDGDVPIPDALGWSIVEAHPVDHAGGWVQRIDDDSAPCSPTSVYDFVYPKGMVEGTAPATVYYRLTADEVYALFWWKPSSPFDTGPNGNKIAFLFNGGGAAGGQQFLILMPDKRLHVLPEYPGDFRWRPPNVKDTRVELGVWHRVEWYANRLTGSVQWSLDGVVQGRYTDVRNAHPFDMFQLSPTWGGNSGWKKRQTDHFWFDHVYLSGR
jgi:hypothetical protein